MNLTKPTDRMVRDAGWAGWHYTRRRARYERIFTFLATVSTYALFAAIGALLAYRG